MNRDEVIRRLRENTYGFLATLENGEPRVRGMMHYITRAGDIVFHTSAAKDVSGQLVDGEPVEYCVFDQKTGVQIRVRGVIERVDDPDLVDTLIAERPFLARALETAGSSSALVVARVARPRAFWWTMEHNLEPKEYVTL